MILKLVCQNAHAAVREVTLDSFPIELGRGVNAGVRIEDRWLSRRHCEISLVDGAPEVLDLDSRHGTYLQGRKVSREKLLPGQILQLGLTYFQVQYSPADASGEIDVSQSDPNLAVA